MNSESSRSLPGSTPSRFAVSLIVAAVLTAWAPAHAQASSDATPSANAASKPAVNGFGPTLKSTAKRRASSGDSAYAPVKPFDDQGQTPEIEMFVGESRVLPAPGVGRIAVGNGQLLTAAALDKREILLFANQPGTSSLFIWNEDGRYQRLKINIVPGDTSRVGREIAAFLSSIPGARASIVGDKVIIEGDRLSAPDLEKVQILAKTYPQVVNFTAAKSWEKMVMMDVKVVEFPRSEMQELGLKWSPTGGGTVGAVWAPIRKGKNGPYQINIPTTSGQSSLPITDPGTSTTTLYSALNVIGGFNIGLNTQLYALAQDGKAAVLAEPQLSARSGATATFLAGGEYPYVVSTINGPTVQFKPYGIRLTIEPTVDRDGYVQSTIDTEVSSIDASVSTPEGPALKTRSTKTQFNVKSGQTMVLSGMLSRDNSTSVDKVPFLGDIPILGALFRSKRYQNNETELVVFVTPVVVDAQSPGLVDRVEKTKERLSQQFGPTPYLSDPLQPGRDAAAPNASSSPASAPTPGGDTSVGKQALPAPATPVVLNQAAPRIAPADTGLVPADQNPLAPAAARSAAAGGANLQVKLEGLALRAAPDVRAPILMKLGAGAVVRLGDQTPPPELTGLWRNVTVGNTNGWVAAMYVTPTTRAVSVPRGGPAAREAQSGKPVSTAITPTSSTTLIGAQAEPAPGLHQYRVMLPQLAMRITPDMNAAIVQQIPEGTLVATSDEQARGGWLPVEFGGKHGWVAAQWLEAQP